MVTTCSIRFIPNAWFYQIKKGGWLVGNWLTHLASLFVCVEKTDSDTLDGRLLDISATYMEMHSKEGAPSRQRSDWTQYHMVSSTWIDLPNMKMLFQNPAFSLLLQCFFPTMRKRYRSKDNQMHLYLLVQESAILVEDDGLLISGNDRNRTSDSTERGPLPPAWATFYYRVSCDISRKTGNDSLVAYTAMRAAWPGELRIKQLRERITHL